MGYSEHILLDRLSNGEESAWRELFRRHYPCMCYLAYQYVHDDYVAETIAADVISHIWEVRESIRFIKSLRSYLLQATKFRCLDYLGTKKEKTEQSFSSSASDILDYSVDDTHPLGILLVKELEKEMLAAIESLPPNTQLAFRKSRFEMLSYEQISAEMGISVNTVKYHIKKALAMLRAEFSKYVPAICFITLSGLL